jgi:hypothetical protein
MTNLFNNGEEAAAFLKQKLGSDWDKIESAQRKIGLRANCALVLDEYGEPEVIPDDHFQEAGKPARQWLVDMPAHHRPGEMALELAERAQAFTEAFTLFEQKANPNGLRHEPWVVPEYDSVGGSLNWLFIFKCENNGSTWRVRWDRAWVAP